MLELDAILLDVDSRFTEKQEEGAAWAAIESETEPLRHYAALPTLVEHAGSNTLRGGMQAGATFGVTTLVGQMLLPTKSQNR